MAAIYQCRRVLKPPQAAVRLPGSKSITNRTLITAALADGTSLLSDILLADDTRLMIEALLSLGIHITVDEDECVAEVTGCNGFIPKNEGALYCGNAGTVIRFCSALCALGHGTYRLSGSARMHERPIGALAGALQGMGAGVEFHAKEGYPPLTLHAKGLRGGEVPFSAPQSSQFVSAVLLASPYAAGDVFLSVAGSINSQPYLQMTTAVMERFGVTVVEQYSEAEARFIIATPQRYQGQNMEIEPDASNASYFLAAPAIVGGQVTVVGLGTRSMQGDVGFVDLLEQMGCRVDRAPSRLTVRSPEEGRRLCGIDVDLNAMPDMVPTLAAVALFAEGATVIRNVANLRVKETDRLSALTTELTKLGARVDEEADGLTIYPPERIIPTSIDTYDDHRMAMSFALVGLGCEGMVINDPNCCEKTFPKFFEHFERMVQGI